MYDHPNPLFLDFETQSACDLPEEGSYRYAEHSSTRILILVVAIDETFHVWLPSYTGVDCSSWGRLRMWPVELQPAHELHFHTGNQCPSVILEAVATRPIVSHNAYGFDKLIWDRCIGSKVCGWLDSMFLSRAAGLPGGLDALSKTILGKGKDRAKELLPKLTNARNSIYGDSFVYPHLPIGDIQAFTRYAIGDVELVRRLWPSFDDLEVEVDIINVNNQINDRGIKLDVPLLKKIEDVAAYSVKMAGIEIQKLTEGRLHEDNIRSTKQVHEWLADYGVSVTDDNGKPCLRKEIVQRYLDSPFIIDEHLSASKEIPPIVCDVLRTRMKALRITDAKVNRAQLRVSKDSRARGLLAYHAAGTGRKSSYGIQIHNLPRPHKYFNTKRMLEIYEQHSGNDPKELYDRITEELNKIEYSPEDKKHPITVDDVSSGMLRPSIIPADGHVFGICDYSQVEARCVAWMCDELDLLKGFAENKDVYKLMATILYNVPLEHVTDSMRQVCKVVILGCGYGMGVHKFRVYCANSGVDLTKAGVTAEQCIETYRNTYTRIAGWKPNRDKNFRVGGLWKELENAIKTTVETGRESYAGKCEYSMHGKTLWARLPSGRVIRYPNCRIEDIIPPYVYTMGLPEIAKATVVYDSPRGVKSLYGGLATENMSQAICRDFMSEAEVRLEWEDLRPVLDVHDEVVCEFVKNKAEESLKRQHQIMSECPQWAPGFPLACEAFLAPRFIKKPFKGWFKIGG